MKFLLKMFTLKWYLKLEIILRQSIKINCIVLKRFIGKPYKNKYVHNIKTNYYFDLLRFLKKRIM